MNMKHDWIVVQVRSDPSNSLGAVTIAPASPTNGPTAALRKAVFADHHVMLAAPSPETYAAVTRGIQVPGSIQDLDGLNP